jgi:hypothetical protein
MLASDQPFRIPLTVEEEAFQPDPRTPEELAYEVFMGKIGDVVEQYKNQPFKLEFVLTPVVAPYMWSPKKAIAAYREWKSGLEKFEPEDVTNFLNRSLPERNWLIPGRLPASIVSVFYAEAGCGKTSFVYNIIKHLSSGTNYNGFPVKKVKCLILQSDEPPVDTNDNMSHSGYRECVQEGTVWLKHYWNSGQLDQTEDWIEENGIEFVVIDSLTGINLGGELDENSPSYASIITRLNEIAGRHNCHIMLIHHSGKNGDLRGTSAIKGAASLVMCLRKGDVKRENLKNNQRILHIEKSRAGNMGDSYLLERSHRDHSWIDYGAHGAQNSHVAKVQTLVYNVHRKNPGKSFTAEQLRDHITNAEVEDMLAAQRDLKRLGLLTCEYEIKQGSKGAYKVSHFKYPIADHLIEEFEGIKQAMLEATKPEDFKVIEDSTTVETRTYIYHNMMSPEEYKHTQERAKQYKEWKAEQQPVEPEPSPIEFELPKDIEPEPPRLRVIKGGVDSSEQSDHNNSSQAERSSLQAEEPICKVGDRIRKQDGTEVVIEHIETDVGGIIRYWDTQKIPVEAHQIDEVLSS